MPTYRYRCVEHGEFNRTVPISQHSNPSDCPTCGEERCKNPCNQIFDIPQLITNPIHLQEANRIFESAADRKESDKVYESKWSKQDSGHILEGGL